MANIRLSKPQDPERDKLIESIVEQLMKVSPRTHYKTPDEPAMAWLAERARIIREVKEL